MESLTPTQLKKLKEHKYSATGTSLVEPYMQIFWRWLVEQIPTTWAPNTLTVVGLILNIATSTLLFMYSPDGKSEAPRFVYLLCAIGLFLYQSLDAIDGKQARRTNTSSPLGELFDHGCDSVSTGKIL
ncbi:ethanolaminephosphotransferase [Mytilus galloprovincialis]|uniref:Ethanolaminephosphotransferase n=1 Tax=Mytilus galloprovincialis TaxID=29158 RepID=A0A8B6GT51_MYTGA|nr:ethanolaminephosphotransferase [Mytilus galloprovincialis]